MNFPPPTMSSFAMPYEPSVPTQADEEQNQVAEAMLRAMLFPPDDNLPCLEQIGRVYAGPGSVKDAPLRGIGLPALTSRAESAIERAQEFAIDQSVKHVMLKQQMQHQQQQLLSLRETIQKQQAVTMMCTLYVGSISFELREDNIETSFCPFGPIKAVNMSRDNITGVSNHKGYAFLEFEVPEAASLAEDQMNGVLMGGRNLRVGRPSNMPQAQHIINSVLADARNYHRIYVSSIHADLTEDDVRTVFEAFGNILSCQLAKGPLGKHRGFGYIEYDAEQSAIDAIASMNLFDLGGQYLRVGRAVTPPSVQQLTNPTAMAPGTLPSAAAIAAAQATAKIQAMEARQAAMSARSQGQPNASAMAQDIKKQLMVSRQMASITGMAAGPGAVAGVRGMAPPVSSMGGVPGVPPMTHPAAAGGVAIPPPPQFALPPPGLAIPRLPGGGGHMGGNSGVANGSNGMGAVDLQAMASTAAPQQKFVRPANQSCVIRMKNMVAPGEVDANLSQEIQEECSNFGRVLNVHIHCTPVGQDALIYVRFSNYSEANKALAGLGGRFFDGKPIIAEPYDEGKFSAGVYM